MKPALYLVRYAQEISVQNTKDVTFSFIFETESGKEVRIPTTAEAIEEVIKSLSEENQGPIEEPNSDETSLGMHAIDNDEPFVEAENQELLDEDGVQSL